MSTPTALTQPAFTPPAFTPPAFTFCRSSAINDFLAAEIATKQPKKHLISPAKTKHNLMLRIGLPPLFVWAVLYCAVEYLI